MKIVEKVSLPEAPITVVTVTSNDGKEAINIFGQIMGRVINGDNVPLQISALTFWTADAPQPQPQHTDMSGYEPEQILEIITDNWKNGMLVEMSFEKGATQ